MRAPGSQAGSVSWEQTMSTTEKVGTAELADLPLFAGLDQTDLESLSNKAVRRILADGETLVDMGAPISEVHWLTKGQLALRVRHEHRWVLVSTLHTGDMLGWSAPVSYTHLRAHETRHDLV